MGGFLMSTQYIIFSTEGPWERSFAGVVGLRQSSSAPSLHDFINHFSASDADTFEYFYADNNEGILDNVLVHNGIDIITLGGVVTFAVEKVSDDEFPRCYFVVDINRGNCGLSG
jgi:hypothetical protein